MPKPTMSKGYSSGYHIELLKGNNWMPWKHQIPAILQDMGLEKYIEKTVLSGQKRNGEAKRLTGAFDPYHIIYIQTGPCTI